MRLKLHRYFTHQREIRIAVLFWTLTLGISGCSFGTAARTDTTAIAPTRTPFPTFTPVQVVAEVTSMLVTVQAAPPITATAALTAPTTLIQPTATVLLTPTVITTPVPDPTLTAPPAAAVPSVPQVTVANEAVNLRGGPDVAYPLIGSATSNQQFAITGRNAAGDWWQICCIAENPAWIYGPLVTVANAEGVAVVTDIPALPVALSAPPATAPATNPPANPVPETQIAEAAPEAVPEPAPVTGNLVPGVPAGHSGTAGNFDASAQYQIVHYRVLGFADNNGGIFSKGGQQFIFLTVLDQNGTPVDGAVVKDAVGDKLNVVTGSKGPGKAEIKMDWDPYKLYVVSDPSGPVTSQISNQLNNPNPHLPDVVGLLGPVENEYAVCPTIDERCTPPFFTIHFSYEITFQRVR